MGENTKPNVLKKAKEVKEWHFCVKLLYLLSQTFFGSQKKKTKQKHKTKNI